MARPRSRSSRPQPSRRAVLQAGAAAGGGLLLSFGWAARALAAPPAAPADPAVQVTAFLRVDAAGCTFICPAVEVGQGSLTGLAMLLCEELRLAPSALAWEAAPAGEAYTNVALGQQLTGGSSSIASSWESMRRAGATARELLRAAAAQLWKKPLAECVAAEGAVSHASGLRATYPELAPRAAKLPVPKVTLTARPKAVVGTKVPRLDAQAKLDGSGRYGLDVVVPGMLWAVVVRCPVPFGRAKAVDDAEARKQPGVRDVVRLPTGVAVLADGTWQAQRAAALVKVEWDEGPLASLDSSVLVTRYEALSRSGPFRRVAEKGDVAAAFARAERRLEAVYDVPFLSHAPMEPTNAVASVTRERCEVWAPTQGPALTLELARRMTGLPVGRISVHTTLVGGSFGRRVSQDAVAEALFLSRHAGRPVKVTWSREDDQRHSFYRPLALHRLEAALSGGKLTGWRHRVVAQSVMAHHGRDFLADVRPFWDPKWAGAEALRPGPEMSLFDVVEGVWREDALVPHLAVDAVVAPPGAPVGFWRSVGHSHCAFAVESFVDEVAVALGKTPLALRRGLLARRPRALGVLEATVRRAEALGFPANGRFTGLAQHDSFDSAAAAVVELSVVEGRVRVHRVVSGLDCGVAVSPSLVTAQIESGVAFAASAALKQELLFAAGRVQQVNFDRYEPLRIDEMPQVEAVIVDSDAAPTGAGEPVVPAIAPAIANAVFAATGKRLRRLPLRP